MEQVLFSIYALIACGGAIAVVVSQNVVRMAFWLVISLSAVAGLFFLLNADFVGATQLLIYVGGTVVLLVFGVMLTANGPYVGIKYSPAEMLQAGVIGLAFLALVGSTVTAVDWEGNRAILSGNPHAEPAAGYNPEGQGNTSRALGTALLGVRFDKDLKADADHHHESGTEHSHTHHPAVVQPSTGYLLPFEIVSVHLLVVLIGAAYLARAKRRAPAPTSP